MEDLIKAIANYFHYVAKVKKRQCFLAGLPEVQGLDRIIKLLLPTGPPSIALKLTVFMCYLFS